METDACSFLYHPYIQYTLYLYMYNLYLSFCTKNQVSSVHTVAEQKCETVQPIIWWISSWHSLLEIAVTRGWFPLRLACRRHCAEYL